MFLSSLIKNENEIKEACGYMISMRNEFGIKIPYQLKQDIKDGICLLEVSFLKDNLKGYIRRTIKVVFSRTLSSYEITLGPNTSNFDRWYSELRSRVLGCTL